MSTLGEKPFAPSCERNRDPILAVLQRHFGGVRRVLEVASGTGQHAVHFAAAMPWLAWQASDRAQHLPGIVQWLDEAALANTPPPLELDVAGAWPATGTVPETSHPSATLPSAVRSAARAQSRRNANGTPDTRAD